MISHVLLLLAQAAPDAADQLQQLHDQEAQLEQSIAQTGPTPAVPSWWSVTDAMTVSAVILGFGIFALALAAWMIRHERDSQVILRVFATIIIITLTVFLIVAGYSDQQIAPAVGLLGTIAGYLLARTTQPPLPRQHQHDDK